MTNALRNFSSASVGVSETDSNRVSISEERNPLSH